MLIDTLKKITKKIEKKKEVKVPKEPTKLSSSMIKWYKDKMIHAAEKGEKECNIIYINECYLTCSDDLIDKEYSPKNYMFGPHWEVERNKVEKVYKYFKGELKLVVDWLIAEGIEITVYPQQLEDDYGSPAPWYNYYIMAKWE